MRGDFGPGVSGEARAHRRAFCGRRCQPTWLTAWRAWKLTERWGQSVIVDNRVGASGNIGAELVAKLSAPDGYTLLMAGAPHTIGVSLFKNLRYDLEKDLVAIANVATFPSVIVVHPSLPAKNVKELVALAKARPGQLNFGSPNIGSPNHLGMELFASMANIRMVHIPYKAGRADGGRPSRRSRTTGVGGVPTRHSADKEWQAPPDRSDGAHTVRAAAGGADRNKSGLRGYEVSSWYGLFGPAALPKEIVNKVSADVLAFLNAPDFKERLATLGAEPAPMKPDQFARYVHADILKWAKVVKASGAKAE